EATWPFSPTMVRNGRRRAFYHLEGWSETIGWRAWPGQRKADRPAAPRGGQQRAGWVVADVAHGHHRLALFTLTFLTLANLALTSGLLSLAMTFFSSAA